MKKLKGPTYKDLLKISSQQLLGYSRGDLAKVVSRIATVANQRIDYFKSKNATIKGIQKRFSVKKKSKQELYFEFIRLRTFFERKDTSFRYYKKQIQQLLPLLNNKSLYDRVYDIYHNLVNESGFYEAFKYETLETIQSMVEENDTIDYDKLKSNINERIKRLYYEH